MPQPQPVDDLVKGVVVFIALVVLVFGVTGVRVWRRASREEPILDMIRGFEWRDGWKELTYRNELHRHFYNRSSTWLKPEEPLSTGTKVDLTVRRGRMELYITIKRDFDNQTRLTLQGEIGDIIDSCRSRRGRDVTIVAVIGLPPEANEALVATQVQALEAHLATRSRGLIREKGPREFAFHVIRVRIKSASSPVGAIGV
jgi:hypothetical protein